MENLPETLQSVLQEAGIQVDMKNLQNPTEDFMVYLVTEYLNKFNFDANQIAKSTTEQLQCLSCPDSALDAIKAINLYSALSSVCNEIFLKDFCLTDITSPGPKRARRQIKILFNFFAYVRNKMVENEIAFIELDNQKKDIEDMIDKKNSITIKIGATIHERENKLELKKQLQEEINKLALVIEKNNKKSREMECEVQKVMKQHQDSSKQRNDLKAKALKLHQEVNELQSKIVKSPEEYAARSKELKKLLEIKKEERQVLNDSITRKKLQIKNNESAQELVKDLNEKFLANTNETCKQLKEANEKLEHVQKDLNLLKAEIEQWTDIEINQSVFTYEDGDLQGHKQLLQELGNQCVQKEREFQTQKALLEELKKEVEEKKMILNNDIKTISITEKENSEIMEQYREYYESEIAEELALREVIENTIKD